jgi:hypothetical protein
MAVSRRRSLRIGIELTVASLAIGGLALGLCGLRVSRAEVKTKPSDGRPPQVTVFAIVATPGSKTGDSKLANIKPQLNRLLPDHGFKLLDARSKPIAAGESLVCDLGHGYTVETSLVQSADENGKVQFRCDLFLNRALQFTATVKVPLNQLFFCERPFLDDGSKLLLGVGAR